MFAMSEMQTTCRRHPLRGTTLLLRGITEFWTGQSNRRPAPERACCSGAWGRRWIASWTGRRHGNIRLHTNSHAKLARHRPLCLYSMDASRQAQRQEPRQSQQTGRNGTAQVRYIWLTRGGCHRSRRAGPRPPPRRSWKTLMSMPVLPIKRGGGKTPHLDMRLRRYANLQVLPLLVIHQ